MRPGVKRWGLRVLVAGVSLYLLCWVATWWWGTAAVRREQGARLQAEIEDYQAQPRWSPPIATVLPSYRVEQVSVPAPFVIDVDYSVTLGFDSCRGGKARWLWVPWKVDRLTDKLGWVS